jgi:hypothetical protein
MTSGLIKAEMFILRCYTGGHISLFLIFDKLRFVSLIFLTLALGMVACNDSLFSPFVIPLYPEDMEYEIYDKIKKMRVNENYIFNTANNARLCPCLEIDPGSSDRTKVVIFKAGQPCADAFSTILGLLTLFSCQMIPHRPTYFNAYL